jgi:hypothetical protein
MPMTDDPVQRQDEETRRAQEKKRRYQEWLVRWRWPSSLIIALNLFVSIHQILQKRSQWPDLLSLHSLTRFGDISSIEWNILCLLVFTLSLVQTWLAVEEHRREQTRLEQERRYQAATLAEGVWPPPPSDPPAKPDWG